MKILKIKNALNVLILFLITLQFNNLNQTASLFISSFLLVLIFRIKWNILHMLSSLSWIPFLCVCIAAGRFRFLTEIVVFGTFCHLHALSLLSFSLVLIFPHDVNPFPQNPSKLMVHIGPTLLLSPHLTVHVASPVPLKFFNYPCSQNSPFPSLYISSFPHA